VGVVSRSERSRRVISLSDHATLISSISLTKYTQDQLGDGQVTLAQTLSSPNCSTQKRRLGP